MRVIVVDDEELMRSGLRLILDGARDIEVVGEASNGRDAIPLIQRQQPDVVLMDIRMPVMDGIRAVKTLHSAQPADRRTPVIMLTAFDTDEFILSALRAGAIGFLLKTTNPEALVAAVRTAASGQQILSPQVVQRLVSTDRELESPQHRADVSVVAPGLRDLSQRETEIAELVAAGLGNAEIAAELFISPTTVKTHIKHIMAKLDATNRIHIAIAVLESR